ncbi:MAG TPA: cupin domain-containing protein [Gemmatimonadales bacterium]|nr:cupin domain-containing protein [Gemmatimonadales bacterium]
MDLKTVVLAALLTVIATAGRATETPSHHAKAAADRVQQEVSCVPVAERAGRKLGCFVTATETLGELASSQVYWHIYTYPNRAAAEKAKGKSGSVVESYGKVWLFTIGQADWKASGGKRIARVGPLPVNDAASYTAQYMEATFMPGMKSRVHRHPGPEAWYVLQGEQCLETPGHAQPVRAGESGIVPEGPPMMLLGTGTSERRSLVLILHDSSKPMTVPAADWQPEGLCHAPASSAAQ